MKKTKILFTLLALILVTTSVDAAVGSRPGVAALKSTTASNFFKYSRELEAEGGALGLNAQFAEESSAYVETTAKNNVDAHMCKNTEWGAVAMLSASSYGAGNGNVKSTYDSSTNIYNVTASTTGNMTGVFGMYYGLASSEYMSAGIKAKMSSSYNKYLINAKNRYVDNYAEGTSSSDFTRYIPGDATFETKSFGSAGYFVCDSGPVFVRGYSGVFDSLNYNGIGLSSFGSRAVVWCLAGL